MMWCAFAVVRHAEAVAEKLGEPYGTLVLTFSVIAIEVSLLASIMLHGENNPTLARDAMFATLMIVLNGMVGAALLMGALRYWEQEYNLEGARAFLVVIAALAVFALIIPNYTKTEPDPSQSPLKALMFAVITVLFYVVFLVIQTMRHRAFFAEPEGNGRNECDDIGRSRTRRRRAARSASTWSCCCSLWLPVVLLVGVSRRHRRFRHRGSRPAGAARRRADRHSGAVAGRADRVPRRARQSLAAGGECVPRLGARHDRAHHPGGVDDRARYRPRGASWADEVADRAPDPDAVRQRAHLRRRRTNVLQGMVHLLLFVVYVALIFSP